jgi:hypothetical protein
VALPSASLVFPAMGYTTVTITTDIAIATTTNPGTICQWHAAATTGTPCY